MEQVAIATKALRQEHGKGIKRKTIAKFNKAVMAADAAAKAGDWDKGFKVMAKVAPKPQDLPEMLQEKVKTAREALVASARARLDEIKNMEPRDAKRALSRFMSKAKKTGFTDEARELLISLKAS